MKNLNKIILILILFNTSNLIASKYDSLFISNTRTYILKTLNFTPKDPLYQHWASSNNPYLYLYVSKKNKVETPDSAYKTFIFIGFDTVAANLKTSKIQDQGFDVFIYKTFANSNTELSDSLLNFSPEAISFIMFHEIMHHYKRANFPNLPYKYEEAAGDILGNYGTLYYANTNQNLSIEKARLQLTTNEEIYRIMNESIDNINGGLFNISDVQNQCYHKIQTELRRCNSFQIYRFNYPVNNAFLLKNMRYSKEYFILKDVFLKAGSIPKFIEILKELAAASDKEKFLQGLK